MNVLLQLGTEYLLIGWVVFSSALFLAAAIGSWVCTMGARKFIGVRPSVSVLRCVMNNENAQDVLRMKRTRQSKWQDNVIVCHHNLSSTMVKQLRKKYKGTEVAVYSPRSLKSLDAILLTAYKKSKKGELVIVLPAEHDLKDSSIDDIAKRMRPNVAISLIFQTPTGVGLMPLISGYIEIIQRVIRYASVAVGERARYRRLSHAYSRDDFEATNQRLRVDWMYVRSSAASLIQHSSTIESAIRGIAGATYVATGVVAGVVSASTQQIGVLGIVWGLTIGWLVTASLGGQSSTKRIGEIVALPLAPFLLFTYVCVYPLVNIVSRRKKHPVYS